MWWEEHAKNRLQDDASNDREKCSSNCITATTTKIRKSCTLKTASYEFSKRNKVKGNVKSSKFSHRHTIIKNCDSSITQIS